MIGLLQRVLESSIEVEGDVVAQIGPGLAVLIGVERGDTHEQADRLLQRLLGYRVFSDAEGKMNLSLSDVRGGLLLVPQFTLPADTRKGMRPSFTPAAPPEQGRELFTYLCEQARERHEEVSAGVFGAHMRFSLVNDGPVTLSLRVEPS